MFTKKKTQLPSAKRFDAPQSPKYIVQKKEKQTLNTLASSPGNAALFSQKVVQQIMSMPARAETPSKPKVENKPKGFANQQPKIERMENEKLTQLNAHFADQNVQNNFYQFRVNNFLNEAKRGKITKCEFIKIEDRETILRQLKNHWYN